MNKLRMSIVSALVLFGGATGGLNSAQAADWWVAVGGAGDGTTSSTPTNGIAATINGAAASDTVHIAEGIYTENDIAVGKYLTLEGAGKDLTVVQAASARSNAVTRVFYLTAGCVLKSMTVRYGRHVENDYGAGIALANNSAFNVTIEDCRITKNDSMGDTVAPKRGGAIAAPGSTAAGVLTLKNCEIVDNTSAGGLYGGGTAGLWVQKKNTVITNCLFEGNAGAAGAGAIYSSSAPLDIGDSTVISNISFYRGGGIYAGGSLTVRRSLIAYNIALNNGGGFYIGDAVHAENTTICNNTAWYDGGGVCMQNSGMAGKTQTFYHCTIANNYAVGDGGGVRRPYGTLKFYGTIVARNDSSGIYKDIYAGAVALCTNSLVGDRTGCPSSIVAGTPNAMGSYVGTSASPVDPRILTLIDNGGPTRTLALGAGSPALDHGINPLSLISDQRGAPYTRTWGAGCDIGAFEYGPFPTTGPLFKTY